MSSVRETIKTLVDNMVERYFKIFPADKMTNEDLLKAILMNVHNEKNDYLNFAKLLDFSDNDFAHDILGLYCHTDVYDFVLKDQFYPRCGFMPNLDIGRDESFRVTCTNQKGESQLFTVNVIMAVGDNECFDGFVKGLKEEIPKHGMYPCVKCRIKKED